MRLGAVVAAVTIGLGAAAVAAQTHPGLRTIRPSGTAELRDWDVRIAAMTSAGELKTRSTVADPTLPGRRHERADQYYKGVRVFGADVTRQTSAGTTVSVFGTIYEGIDLDVTPALTAEEARQRISQRTGVRLGANRTPELMVLPRTGGGYTLTYRARVATSTDIHVYFLDARTGQVVFDYSDLETQSAVGRAHGVLGDEKKISVTPDDGIYEASDQLRPPAILSFDLRGNLDRTMAFLNGEATLFTSDLASDTDNDWTDGPNVDAHVYSGWTYDYYFKRFGRRGLNNGDKRMVNLVHPVHRQNLASYSDDVVGTYFLNAFYAGDGVMVYGEGLPPGYVLSGTGQTVDFFAGALDVAAHELTHGVTDYTSQLIYLNESGALNEAFSDVMGTSVEFFYQPAGSGLLRADYLIGEDIIRPGGIRSMSNPSVFGDPDHYGLRYTGSDDNGGVHINSAIPNQAFYLAIEGGTNRTSGLAVAGVGSANRDQIEQVFYRAFTLMLSDNASFSVARAACEQAARDLYGASSGALQAVSQAWAAVGVN
jgi:thermolysin